MGVESSQLGRALPPRGLEDHVLEIARGDPGAVYRAAEMQAVFGTVPVFPQGILYNTQHLMYDMKDSRRNQGYSALRHQQEQFERASQEHQREAQEDVPTAAALASRTASQNTSRFRNMENNAEANFSQQQHGLLSEIVSE